MAKVSRYAKYFEQWDLPYYPDDEPQEKRRNILGIEKREEVNTSNTHADAGFFMWYGGCGIGLRRTFEEAVQGLHQYAVSNHQRRVNELEQELAWHREILRKLGGNPTRLGPWLNLEEPTDG